MRRGWIVLSIAIAVVACAHATKPTAIDWRPAAGVTTVDCNDSEPLVPDATVELLRELCGEDVAAACSALAEKTRLAAPDDALIRAKLEPRCNADPRCGCAHLGHALLSDRSEKQLLRAGDLLDASCHRGALDACDDMALYASLCSVSPPTPLCDRLRSQGRVPAREEEPSRKELPIRLQECFVVVTAMSRAECPVANDGSPMLGAGSIVCTDTDRISAKTATGRWNQRLARWIGLKDGDWISDEVSGLRIDAKSWDTIELTLGCTEGRLALLPGRWFQDARRLPRVEAICDRMKRCVAAVARMFPPIEDDSPPPELPDDLLGCADYQARMTKLVPSPPTECR